MKLIRRTVAFVAAVMLFAVTAFAVLSAEDAKAEPGETATLTFSFTDIYNVDGMFSLDDPHGIVAGYTVGLTDAGSTSVTVVGDHLLVKPGTKPVSADISVTVKVTLKDDATVGKGCTVMFSGVYGDAGQAPGNEQKVGQGVRLVVAEAEKEEEMVAAPPPVRVDYTALERQITIANGVDTAAYTQQSANALETALETARNARKSKNQEAVTIAAKALENAMSALVKMDYSELRSALEDVGGYLASEELGTLWQELERAVSEGEKLLDSRDQAAVDAAEEEITAALERIDGVLNELKTPEVVEVEVPVEVLPEEDYCNIPAHRLWPVLFWISLAANIVLMVVLVTILVKKKKYQNDDTPLVDYDIDYDLVDDI